MRSNWKVPLRFCVTPSQAPMTANFSWNAAPPKASSWTSRVKNATDSYNATIKAVAEAKGLAFVDFKAILQEASTSGLEFGNYNMNTSLVTGGLVGLDGVHLTGRGYALMANKMLAAIDATYGSNFTVGKDGLAKPDDYPTNYSPTLQ